MQVWANVNFEGNSLVVEGSIQDLAQVWDGRMNDSISSLKVESGEWVLWSNANFSGIGIKV
ncbi:MAG: beta/gamma crystallin-related protein [Rhizonema sp. PD37]|nr:beta/gamma crystallin-related protein [Rhizonema sp. PD37]